MDEQTNIKQQEDFKMNKFTMIWKDILYQVQLKDKKVDGKLPEKAIINKVSGYAKSGEVTAIMGPSGCGKTSLLNYLNDRIAFPPGSSHSGELYINNQKLNVSQIAELSSYVMQDDLLFDILTPRETLLFVAKLRRKKTQEEYEKEVDTLLEELKLTKCKDTRIGNAIRKGISGGERKRVSIGIEIISSPSILFLDEPTSGLDSQTSFIVIDFLKELAKTKNMVVIFTIHQPSSNIFGLFDRLLLLNKGSEVYQGPTLEIIPYFSNIKMPLGEKSNPADAFMHKMEEQNSRIDFKSSTEESLNSLYKKNMSNQIFKEIEEITNSNIPNNLSKVKIENVNFITQFGILCQRAALNIIRNPLILRIKIVMVLIFSFLACSIFYNMQNDTIGLYNKAGFFFFFTINNFMTNLFAAVLAFPSERGVFLREHSSKLYGVLPYYLSKNVIETPISLLGSFVFSIIVYYIVGLRPEASHYFTFILSFICLVWLSQSMGLLFGAAFKTLNAALVITQFSVLPAFLFSGFLINQANMPVWLAWIRFISPFRYSLESSMRNEFDNNPNIPESMNVVTQLNLDIGMWNCIGIMVAFGFGLRILGFFALRSIVSKTG